MANLKSTYPAAYCTPLDVRALSKLLKPIRSVDLPTEEEENLVISDREIMKHILDCSSIVKSYLAERYGTTLLAGTPYFSPVIPDSGNNRPHTSWGLDGVAVGSSATTEQWTITFNSQTVFSVRGQISGVQGSGTTSADFTSTSGDVVIDSDNWDIASGNPEPDDVLYFATYKHYQIVVLTTAKLAAAHVLKSLLSETSPNESGIADNLEKEAMDILEKLSDTKSGVTLTGSTEISDLWVHARYSISLLGEDKTEYETETGTGTSIVDDWDGNYS